MCLIFVCSCVVFNPLNSIAKGNDLVLEDFFVANSEQIIKIEIMSGVTGEQKNITSEEYIAEIMSILKNSNFVEYEKSGNAGGWIYNLRIYSANNETPFEYTISYGFVKDEKNYKLEDTTKLKETVERIFNASSPENTILVSSQNGDIVVKINNEIIEFNDAPFIDENGRTQVPVRELCEFLNKRVYWYENPQRVAISTVPAELDNTNGGGAGGDSIQFVIGENKYSKNGKEFPMDTAARIINNRTYIPLRIAGEFLNYEVIWQE